MERAGAAAGDAQQPVVPPQVKFDQALAQLFYEQLGFGKLSRDPQQLAANPLATKVLRFLEIPQPHQERIDFTFTDFKTLIHRDALSTITPTDTRNARSSRNKEVKAHLETLASFTLGPALAHIDGCDQCKILRQGKGRRKRKQLSDNFICGLVEIAWDSAKLDPQFLNAAISHYRACRNDKKCQYPSQYTSVVRALEYTPPSYDVFLSATVQMGRLVNWLGENRGRFADVLSSMNVYIMELADPYRQQGADQLLSLAFAAGNVGRVVRAHKLSIGVGQDEDYRINSHANRRFRWLYFLMIAAHGDPFEYEFTGAFLQFGQGSTDFPACHSILGGLNRRRPGDTVWQLGTCFKTFERFSFFKVMNTTVALHTDRNQLDISMENALKDRASNLLTQVALDKLLPDAAFGTFCGYYTQWATQSTDEDPAPEYQDRPYIGAHLVYINLWQEDPFIPFRSTEHSDSHFNEVVQRVLRSSSISPKKLVTQWDKTKVAWFTAIKRHLLDVDFTEQGDAGSPQAIELPPFQGPASPPPGDAAPAAPSTRVTQQPDQIRMVLDFTGMGEPAVVSAAAGGSSNQPPSTGRQASSSRSNSEGDTGLSDLSALDAALPDRSDDGSKRDP